MSERVLEAVGPRAYRCYRELIRFISEHGYVPSYVELGQALGRSPSTVKRYLDALEEAGYVRRKPGQARSIMVRSVVG